jgi:hypothetical protein
MAAAAAIAGHFVDVQRATHLSGASSLPRTASRPDAITAGSLQQMAQSSNNCP